MATNTTTNKDESQSEIALDIPNNRKYADDATAELDAALVEAIQKAEAANHEFLACLLRTELGSLYYEEQTSI